MTLGPRDQPRASDQGQPSGPVSEMIAPVQPHQQAVIVLAPGGDQRLLDDRPSGRDEPRRGFLQDEGSLPVGKVVKKGVDQDQLVGPSPGGCGGIGRYELPAGKTPAGGDDVSPVDVDSGIAGLGKEFNAVSGTAAEIEYGPDRPAGGGGDGALLRSVHTGGVQGIDRR